MCVGQGRERRKELKKWWTLCRKHRKSDACLTNQKSFIKKRCPQTCVLDSGASPQVTQPNPSSSIPTSLWAKKRLLGSSNLSSTYATSSDIMRPLLKPRNLSYTHKTLSGATHHLLISHNLALYQTTWLLLKPRNLSSRPSHSIQVMQTNRLITSHNLSKSGTTSLSLQQYCSGISSAKVKIHKQ